MKSDSTARQSDSPTQKLFSWEEAIILARFARRAMKATRDTVTNCTFVLL